MKRNWLEPIARLVQSLFDESIPDDAYCRFLERSVRQLCRALDDGREEPPWVYDFRLAMTNLRETRWKPAEMCDSDATGSLKLPPADQAHDWFAARGSGGIIRERALERHTAVHLLALWEKAGWEGEGELNTALERLLRHVEVRRKDSVRVRDAAGPLDRWYESHDLAILFARAARQLGDLRFLNAAMKLNDWALPVHRRSVPVGLLACYVVSISETRRVYEELL